MIKEDWVKEAHKVLVQIQWGSKKQTGMYFDGVFIDGGLANSCPTCGKLEESGKHAEDCKLNLLLESKEGL